MKSIFKGRHVEKIYSFNKDPWYSDVDFIIYQENIVKNETFYTTILDRPPLEVHDKFYIGELDEVVKIVEAMRGEVDGMEAMIYFTNKVLSTVEDKESLEMAKNKRDIYFEEQRAYEKQKEMEQKDKQNRTLWQKFITLFK